MDSDSWTRLSTSSRQRYQSRSDPFYGGDEMDGEDEVRPEFICPFCAEDFDMVGLCCHMDEEHTVEAKNGVCPVCEKRVGTDLVGHERIAGRKFAALLGGTFSSNTEPDPWLSSFILNSPSADEPTRVQPSSAEASAIEKISIEDLPERNIPQSPLSDKDQEEKARKCEFVQGLLLSTFLDGDEL
ncbi:hypothetical protein RJ639_042473 [Escallonia herrerae]|uniref:Drought induced 19 protein type zinc-binding domain-containing protein n=1 Tax=Escallonia herrerae TaxID=1293975 RepID=A0AA89B644_9ASTE|nr:hypothetical protein RJ639_042473 [Escallonia herrerae]